MKILYGKYPFTAEEDDEMSFEIGERIQVINDDQEFNDGWYLGRNEKGEKGLFPVNFTIDFPQQSIKDWDVMQVCDWLQKVGGGRWSMAFQHHKVSGDVLLDLGLAGLRELGIEPLSQRIDVYRKIMNLRQDSIEVEDAHSDYAADIYNDYQESQDDTAENITPNTSINSLELDSPSTLIEDEYDDCEFRHKKDGNILDDDHIDNLENHDIICSDDQTLKDDNHSTKRNSKTLLGKDDSVYNSREGLSESLARKWSELAKEYNEKFTLDEENPDTPFVDIEDWIYVKLDHRGWKKRFASLTDGILYIFKEQTKRFLVTSIDISQGYKVSPDSENTKTQYSFKLVHPISHSVYLAASCQTSMLNWINKLVKVGLERRNPLILVPIKNGKDKPLPSVPPPVFPDS